LINAVNRFDIDYGADFLSFAVPTMMGEVRRHFRDYGWAIKVPHRVKELQPQLLGPAQSYCNGWAEHRTPPKSRIISASIEASSSKRRSVAATTPPSHRIPGTSI
jgi:DNA-directed RNA polymerase specialized sigma subunit